MEEEKPRSRPQRQNHLLIRASLINHVVLRCMVAKNKAEAGEVM